MTHATWDFFFHFQVTLGFFKEAVRGIILISFFTQSLLACNSHFPHHHDTNTLETKKGKWRHFRGPKENLKKLSSVG